MEEKKVNNFKVEPLTVIKKSKRQIMLEALPDPAESRPYLMLISAKTGSGKSILIANLLRKKELYYKYYAKCYFCSSNMVDGKISDVAYNGIRFAKARSFDNFTDEIFDTILQDITKDDDWKDEQYLLVLDDLSTVFERPTKNMLKNFLKHRHYNLSIIIVSQAIRLMNPKLRQNATHLISFYTSNQREREALNELTNLSQSKFDELLEYCTDENFCFMFIDLLQPRKPKIYKNFNSEIVY